MSPWGFRLLPAVAAAFFLAACAAENVTPVAMAQPGDEQLSCAALTQQIAANSAGAEEFMKKDKQVDNVNTAKAIGSAIPYVGIAIAASTDLSEADQVKARALIDRDERLNDLAKRKGCVEQ